MRMVRAFAFFAASIMTAGCASAPPPKPSERPRSAEVPDAASAATEIVHGRVGALIHMDRTRWSSLSRLPEIYHFVRPLFARLHVDEKRDIDRFFVAVDRSSSYGSAIVIEHRMSSDRVEAAFGEMARDEKVEMQTKPFLATLARLEHWDRFVAEPRPGLLVVLPSERAEDAARFVHARGLPLAMAAECASFYAGAPGETLSSGFSFPWDFKSAEATITLDGEGGATIVGRGEALNAWFASKDAASLTEKAADATSVDILSYKLQVFTAPVFSARGSDVTTTFHLSKDELDWIVVAMLDFYR